MIAEGITSNGAAGPVWCCQKIQVDVGQSLLGEVYGTCITLVGGSLKVCAKEPVHRAHEVDLELGHKEVFKSVFGFRVLKEVHNVVHIYAQVEGLVANGGWVVGKQENTPEHRHGSWMLGWRSVSVKIEVIILYQ